MTSSLMTDFDENNFYHQTNVDNSGNNSRRGGFFSDHETNSSKQSIMTQTSQLDQSTEKINQPQQQPSPSNEIFATKDDS